MPIAFITGGSGFLGRNLPGHLLSNGYCIRVLYRSPEARDRITSALGQEGQGSQSVEMVAGDLSNVAALQQGMQVLPAAADSVTPAHGQERSAPIASLRAASAATQPNPPSSACQAPREGACRDPSWYSTAPPRQLSLVTVEILSAITWRALPMCWLLPTLLA
jgi:uncharacterized protein YbjT (DUF2867 family)